MKPTYLALNFSPSVELIRPIRLFVTEFFEHILTRGEESERLELATQEMLENAMKYGKEGEARLRVAVSPLARGAHISVHTQNSASPSNIQRLQSILKRLEDGDPKVVYLKMMTDVPEGDASGLGLARIRAEADMDITWTITGDDVDLRAQGRVETLARAVGEG